MMRRALLAAVLGALAMFVAVSPAHAAQEFFLVTGTADGTGACAPYPDFPGGFSCTTLRAAISAANANPGEDVVVLQATGTYPVSSMFLLTDNIEIAGQNAQTTFLNGNDDRLFEVAPDVSAVLYGVTLQNGVAPAGDGGAVINNGTLELDYSRVTQSSTVSGNGGGILNNGNLVLNGALIDDNDSGGFDGGGIYSEGSVTAIDSTIFANTGGGGIYSFQGASLSLIHVTVAGNTSGSGSAGVHTGGLSWSSTGSLFVSNTGDGVQKQNCDAVPSGTGNMDDGVTCEVTSKTTAQIGLATTLQNLGGQTDVLAIPHTSAAKASVSPCVSGSDQRGAPRNAEGACDAGAFEEGATAPPVSGFAFPAPTPVGTPTPTPTPTVTPAPTPVAGKSVVAKPVKGTIKIKLPGTNTFVDLEVTQGIPDGSTLDTRHGTVQLTSIQKPGGKLQTAIFFDGLFKLTQTKTTTDLTLNEPLAPCRKRAHAAAAAAKQAKTRKLWGSGHGSFRTRGQYSAATVRGTKWLVEDSCAGTLTRVAHGVVSVRDNVRHKTITLRAGKQYLARPKR